MLTCSVVITTKDRPGLLAVAIASVLRQSHRPEEIIVVDDGSAVWPNPGLEALAKVNPSLQVVRHPISCGSQAARNAGALTATGDILMFLDDDDAWRERKIEAQLAQFSKHADLALVYTGMNAIAEVDGKRRLLHRSSRHVSGAGWPDLLYRNFVGPTSAAAFPRRLFEAIGGFDPAMPAMQDHDLWLRLSRLGPVAYDGEYNLDFLADAASSGQRISRQIERYDEATSMIERKVALLAAADPRLDMNRVRAFHKILMASKHIDKHQWFRASAALAVSVWHDPKGLVRIGRGAFGAARRLVLGPGLPDTADTAR